MRFAALLLILTLSSASAFASDIEHHDIEQSYEFYTTYHYSGVAYGKTVKSVRVHTGVYKEIISNIPTLTTSSTWESVQDIDLSSVGDHFFGKQSFSARSKYNERGSSTPIGVAVQYWVQFVDGSSLVSDVYVVKPITGMDVPRSAPNLRSLFQAATDADATVCSAVELLSRS